MRNPVVVFPERQAVEIEDRPVPKPDKMQVLICTRTTLISTGTELTIFGGDFPDDSYWAEYADYPFVPGYSNVGLIVDVGKGVDRKWIGKRVATYGPHAQYFCTEVDQLRPILYENVSDESASFFTIAEIVMNGVRRSGVRWGDSAAIYGLGLLGQLTTRICRLIGVRPVLGFEVEPARLAYLIDEPAMIGINPKETDVRQVVESATRKRMVDVVFEVTGQAALIPRQFEVLRTQGRFVILSSPRGKTDFDFHDLCNHPSYTIIGAHNESHPPIATPDNPWTCQRDAELFFDLLHDRELDTAALISHRQSYADAPSLYQSLLHNRASMMGVVLRWMEP